MELDRKIIKRTHLKKVKKSNGWRVQKLADEKFLNTTVRCCIIVVTYTSASSQNCIYLNKPLKEF